MLEQQNILVTGANGFLGQAICRLLRGQGLTVIGAGRRERPACQSIEYAQADLTAPADCARLVPRANIVIHCAGLAHMLSSTPDKSLFHLHNVTATENLLRAAAETGLQHFVYVSSSSVYGSGQTASTENSTLRPDSDYGISKVEAENAARQLCSRNLA